MSLHEVTIGLEFLYTTLSGDPTLQGLAVGGFWRGMAPAEDINGNPLQTPFVVFAYQGGTDKLTMNGVRLFVNMLFQVKAVGPAALDSTVMQAAAQIDKLLKRTNGTVTGGNVDACFRESPFFLDEIINGKLWTNQGGIYRFLVEQTS